MGTYHFGVGNGRVPAKLAARIKRIAQHHGCHFTAVNLPGEGHRYWFSGPNLGFPFDRAMSDAVKSDLADAGIDVAKLGARQ